MDNSVVSPVLALPPEITSEIFFYYVLDPCLGHSGTFTPSRGPLTLAAVCQSWRDICFSTPCLWASLRIYPNKSWVVDDFIYFLKCWLRRAGNHPLDLHIDNSILSTKILSVICHHAPQLRTLGFSLDASRSFPSDEIWGSLPLLRKLAVRMPKDDSPVAITAFRDVPHLRELRLTGTSLRCISLPWIQLTRLEFWGESAFSCVQVLKETPNLEVLEVCLGGSPNVEPSHPSHVMLLPYLHTLKFTETYNSELLGRLVLPVLKTIHLTRLRSHSLSSFLDLGVRSAWSPRSIHLTETEVDSCIACLQSLPSATQVEIGIRRGGDPNVDLLLSFLQKDDRRILPVLETLTLRVWRSLFDSRQLREMLASRSTGAHDGQVNLKSFQLVYWRQWASQAFADEIWAELRPLIDVGLEVSINSDL
ncbi:F-box domain-containing protein [Mycena sanguinolenta]|uniref:F-box domain-containing protein n=1 Tax=Mycena sanguinolenta TaxID=230812 RepID=A0A8H6YYE5_9AGAR|nr:F-box domain-containing protein [Mycena sanguinolenta]